MKKTLTTLAVAVATIITTAGAAAAAPVFDIKPAALTRGADVQIAHIEGHSVVDGSIRIEVPAARVTLLGKTGSSYVIQTHNADYRNAQVWKMRPDGSRTRLLHGRSAEDVVLSDKGATLVSATGASGGRTQLLAIDVASGDVSGARKLRGQVSVLDVGRWRVVVGSWSRPRTMIWNLKTQTARTVVHKVGYFADLSSDRFAFFTKDPYRDGCSVLTHISSPADRVWRSCHERIETTNADGTRIATVHILSDGIGPNRFIVRTATGGKLATYNTAGYFGLAQFEDGNDLLLDTTGKKKAATVRCDLSGCERASDLRDAEF